MTRIMLATVLVFAACKGDGADPEDTNDTNDDPTPTPGTEPATNEPVDTTDTGGNTGEFVPAGFTVSQAAFAVDETNSARGYTGLDAAGAPVATDVVLLVTLINEDAATSGQINGTNSCSVVLSSTDPRPQAPFAADAGIWWGFELPAGTTVVDNSCDAFNMPAAWSDPAGVISAHAWGFGLNDMQDQVLTALEPQFGANWPIVEPAIVGGGWYSSALAGQPNFPGGFVDGGYALGSELDDTFTVTTDEAGQANLIPSIDVYPAAGSNIGIAGYSGQGLIFLQPADLLLGTP